MRVSDRGTALVESWAASGVRFGLQDQIDLHPGTIIEGPTWLLGDVDNHQPIRIGAFSYSHSRISSWVRGIGRYCSIARDVTLGELEHPTEWLSTSSFVYDDEFLWGDHLRRTGGIYRTRSLGEEEMRAGVLIGNDVWIGARAYVRSGVCLGDGCIVGADTVVTRDVPPYAVVVGNPGRVVRHRFPPELVSRLLEVQWWRHAFTDLDALDIRDVVGMLDAIVERRSAGDLHHYEGCQRGVAAVLAQLEATLVV